MSKVYRHSDGSYRDYAEFPQQKEIIESDKPFIHFYEPEGLKKVIFKEKETSQVLDPNHLEEKKVGKKDAIGDLNKPRLSLIPQKALWALGGALTYGEKHYGTHNWRNGIKVSYLLDAALRHINEFNAGENIDQKSQNHHLGNAMANLAMAIELCESNPEMDDRYKSE